MVTGESKLILLLAELVLFEKRPVIDEMSHVVAEMLQRPQADVHRFENSVFIGSDVISQDRKFILPTAEKRYGHGSGRRPLAASLQ